MKASPPRLCTPDLEQPLVWAARAKSVSAGQGERGEEGARAQRSQKMLQPQQRSRRKLMGTEAEQIGGPVSAYWVTVLELRFRSNREPRGEPLKI